MKRAPTNGSSAASPSNGVWWLEEALAAAPLSTRPPLSGRVRADVCVIGGGFTGLWTALEIREQSPDTSVVLIEREACGFGASGRNGGWLTGWHDELDLLIHRFGVKQGLRLAERSAWAIQRVVQFAAERKIDCSVRQQGALWTATSAAQLGSWKSAVDACRAHGRDGYLKPIGQAELARLTGSALPLAGARQTDAAAVQPAKLALGLRQAALDAKVTIFEGTPVLALASGRPAVVTTPAGQVEAERIVVATGAYSGWLRPLRRAFVPVPSHLIVTAPLGKQLDRLPWADGTLLGDSRLMVHYAQVTADGRIVFGRGGGAIGPAGRVVTRHFHDPAATREIIRDFHRFFPQFARVEITHAWGGPVDRSPGHLPFVGTLGDLGETLYGLGYSGNGVAPSALVGRILGRSALGIADEDTTSALTGGPPAYLPPEPLRWAAGTLVAKAVKAAEAQDDSSRFRHSLAAPLRPFVNAHVPRLLEPRLRRSSSRAHDASA